MLRCGKRPIGTKSLLEKEKVGHGHKYMTGAEAPPRKSPAHGLNRQCFQGSRTHLVKEATRDHCMR